MSPSISQVRPGGLALGCILLLCSACQDPRTDVPGHLEPGSVDRVVHQADAQVSQVDRHPGPPVRILPPGASEGEVPLVSAPGVQAIWFYPRLSRDRQSRRDGCWVYTIIGPSIWCDSDGRAMDDDGPSQDPAMGPPSALTSGSGSGPSQPWIPAGGAVRTTVVLDRPSAEGGPALLQSTAPLSAFPPLVDPNTHAPDRSAIDALVERARSQISAAGGPAAIGQDGQDGSTAPASSPGGP